MNMLSKHAQSNKWSETKGNIRDQVLINKVIKADVPTVFHYELDSLALEQLQALWLFHLRKKFQTRLTSNPVNLKHLDVYLFKLFLLNIFFLFFGLPIICCLTLSTLIFVTFEYLWFRMNDFIFILLRWILLKEFIRQVRAVLLNNIESGWHVSIQDTDYGHLSCLLLPCVDIICQAGVLGQLVQLGHHLIE